jgi:hypothetical protein
MVCEGDPLRVTQIINNLLSNAIKFTASGGIRVQLDWFQEQACIRVEDSGIGMSEEQLIKALKAATVEQAIVLDGCQVGYAVKTTRTPRDAAMSAIRSTWAAANGDLSGLLTAIKPTMAMLSAIAKRLYPDSKDDQTAIVEQWSTVSHGKEFGVYRP